MEKSFLVRFGGLMAIVSGILLAFAHSVDLFAVTETGTTLGKVTVFAAHLLLVFAFYGFYEAQGSENKWIGSIGLIVGVIGTSIVAAIVFVEIAASSGVNVDAVLTTGVNGYIYSFGPLLFVAGMLLIGSSIIKNNILPPTGGLLLLVGTVVFALGTVTGSLEALITALGAIITGTGLVWSGLPLIRKKQTIVSQAA